MIYIFTKADYIWLGINSLCMEPRCPMSQLSIGLLAFIHMVALLMAILGMIHNPFNHRKVMELHISLRTICYI